jgi:hypothetical protein
VPRLRRKPAGARPAGGRERDAKPRCSPAHAAQGPPSVRAPCRLLVCGQSPLSLSSPARIAPQKEQPPKECSHTPGAAAGDALPASPRRYADV